MLSSQSNLAQWEKMYKSQAYTDILQRMRQPRRFIQVLAGPRKVGKTTLANGILNELAIPQHYAASDEPARKDRFWIEKQWNTARKKIHVGSARWTGILVLDEIQKIHSWAETVRRLWDEDTAAGILLHVILIGSSPPSVLRGLDESLAGCFELTRLTHWSYSEMQKAFGWSLDQYLYYGGYPGAGELIDTPSRWSSYIVDSITEPAIAKDILLHTRVDKPALLHGMFELGCDYSGETLSYQKMLVQLPDAGNTVTLANYLRLFQGVGLLAGLPKYTGEQIRRRASSPKLIVLNTALMTAASYYDFDAARWNPDFRGRLVETAVGAYCVNSAIGSDIQVCYWAGQNREVDFVLVKGSEIVALEVRSDRRKLTMSGTEKFRREFPVTKEYVIGPQGIPVEEFLRTPPASLF